LHAVGLQWLNEGKGVSAHCVGVKYTSLPP
jgi:hypothetical protein